MGIVKEALLSEIGDISPMLFLSFCLEYCGPSLLSYFLSQRQFESRLFEIVTCVKQLFQQTATESEIQCFDLFLKIRFEVGEIDLNAQSYSESAIEFLIPCLIQCNQYEKAMKCLPETASRTVLNCIASHLEFASFLAVERRDWIRRQDIYDIYEENTRLDFIMAGRGVESMDDLTVYADIFSFAVHIYANCSLESIERLLQNCPSTVLVDHFQALCTSKMDSACFLQILTFLRVDGVMSKCGGLNSRRMRL